MDELQAVISLISGGLAGAGVNAVITNRKQKLDVTLSVIKDFFSFYEHIGQVKGVFSQEDIMDTLSKSENLVLLRRVGDWFHYVASLVKEGAVDKEFLDKVGVIKEAKSFRENISSAKGRASKYLENSWSWWPNLENFK